MRTNSTGLVALLALTVFVSGCASSSGKSDQDPPEGTSVVQGTTEALPDAGSIEGVVTDDSLLPLQGAVVAIQDVEGQAMTDEAGHFAFQNLAPGSYVVLTAKLGFESNSRRVDVLAKEATKVQFMLSPIAIKESFLDVIEFRLRMGCGGGLVAVTFTGGCPNAVTGDHRVVADHNVTKEVEAAIAELTWTANTGFSSKRMRLDMGKDETGGNTPRFTYPYGSTTGTSPVVVRSEAPFAGLSKSDDDSSARIRHRVWVPFSSSEAPIVIIVLQQPMTVWSTMAYGDVPPEDYSALPDG